MYDTKASITQARARYANDWTSDEAQAFLDNVKADHSAMRWAALDESIPGMARFFAAAGAWNEHRALAMWEALFAFRRPLSEIDWMASEEGRALGISLNANLANPIDLKKGRTHVNPLAVAARRGRLNVVRHLIQLGCPVGDGQTTLNPLSAHVQMDAWREGTPKIAIMQALVDAGAPLTGGYRGPLFALLQTHRADGIPWLTALHAMGMPTWDQDPSTGDTPLHVLARQTFLSAEHAGAWLDALAPTLAHFDWHNRQGETPFDVASPGPTRAMAAHRDRLEAQRRQAQTEPTTAPTRRARPRS